MFDFDEYDDEVSDQEPAGQNPLAVAGISPRLALAAVSRDVPLPEITRSLLLAQAWLFHPDSAGTEEFRDRSNEISEAIEQLPSDTEGWRKLRNDHIEESPSAETLALLLKDSAAAAKQFFSLENDQALVLLKYAQSAGSPLSVFSPVRLTIEDPVERLRFLHKAMTSHSRKTGATFRGLLDAEIARREDAVSAFTTDLLAEARDRISYIRVWCTCLQSDTSLAIRLANSDQLQAEIQVIKDSNEEELGSADESMPFYSRSEQAVALDIAFRHLFEQSAEAAYGLYSELSRDRKVSQQLLSFAASTNPGDIPVQLERICELRAAYPSEWLSLLEKAHANGLLQLSDDLTPAVLGDAVKLLQSEYLMANRPACWTSAMRNLDAEYDLRSRFPEAFSESARALRADSNFKELAETMLLGGDMHWLEEQLHQIKVPAVRKKNGLEEALMTEAISRNPKVSVLAAVEAARDQWLITLEVDSAGVISNVKSGAKISGRVVGVNRISADSIPGYYLPDRNIERTKIGRQVHEDDLLYCPGDVADGSRLIPELGQLEERYPDGATLADRGSLYCPVLYQSDKLRVLGPLLSVEPLNSQKQG